MNDRHADERDRKRNKARYGMKVTNRNIKSVILYVIGKKAKNTTDKRTK